MEKIWLMTQESKVDGYIFFNVIPCATEEAAKAEMKKEIRVLMNESHYMAYTDRPLDFIREETETSYYIEDTCDAYYEDIRIVEKEIVK